MVGLVLYFMCMVNTSTDYLSKKMNKKVIIIEVTKLIQQTGHWYFQMT